MNITKPHRPTMADSFFLWLYPRLTNIVKYVYTRASAAYEKQTAWFYYIKFSSQVQETRAELAQLGIIDAQLDSAIASNDIRMISARLRQLANKIPEATS